MSRMFGQRINEFVLSIDTLDNETFTDLLQLIQVYVHKQLNVAYFSVLDETTVNNQRGLRTLWSTMEEKPSYTVSEDKDYESHSAYTFGENKPVWVVYKAGIPLEQAEAEDLKDMWSKVDNLPSYKMQNQQKVQTSVMHPLRKEGRSIGVIEFAAEEYIEPTPASLEEVQTLAMIISRAYQMFDIGRIQRENTVKALRMLEEALEREKWTRLALPQLFVAYPGGNELGDDLKKKHQAVIETMKKIIDEFKNILKIIYWEDINEPGNINTQVIRDIGNSDFGVCYFSKPTEEGKFEDNSNVLFEAGMMQALANSPNALLRAWLPIREKESTDIPFDIASERMLLINREDGHLDVSTFSGELRERLNVLFEISRSKKND